MAIKATLNGELMFPSEYLAAVEFKGRDVTLTIQSVSMADLIMVGGSKKRKPVMTFTETAKKMVLNKTNASSIIQCSRETRAIAQAIEKIEAFATDKQDFDLELAKARALMRGYANAWEQDSWQAVPGSLESTFMLPIVNPDTGRISRTFKHAGKLDGLCTRPDLEGTFLLEHKTTSERLDDPAAPYWQRLEIDSQVSGYSLACWQNDIKLAGTLYDVIRKPVIAPGQIPVLDENGLKIVVDNAGQRVLNKNGSYKQSADREAGYSIQTRPETTIEFEQRLTEDCVARPSFYFARKLVWRTDRELFDFARELWHIADEIRDARVNKRHYRNSGACLMWNRPCEYLPICSGRDDISSDHWQKRNIHQELPIAQNGDGNNWLTNSRMQCFRTCRKKHELRYELGLERIDKEESKALVFGTMLHLGLETWWKVRCETI